MSNIVYQRKNFFIYQEGNGYIVHNRNKNFKDGHTHIRYYRQAVTILNNCLSESIPKTRNAYLLKSYIRILEEGKFKEEIEKILKERQEDENKIDKGNRS